MQVRVFFDENLLTSAEKYVILYTADPYREAENENAPVTDGFVENHREAGNASFVDRLGSPTARDGTAFL